MSLTLRSTLTAVLTLGAIACAEPTNPLTPVFASADARPADSYSVEVLDYFPGAGARVVAMNENGDVLAETYSSTGTRAHLWRNGVRTDLPTLGGSQVSAFALNEAGQVIGSSSTANPGEWRAFIFSGGVMTEIVTSNPALPGAALAINAHGQVVGYANDHVLGRSRTFVWHNGTTTWLDDGGKFAVPYAINDDGDIAGAVYVDGSNPTAAAWRGGVLTLLETTAGVHSESRFINRGGDIAGPRWGVGNYTGFVWRNGRVQLIAEELSQTHIRGMNDRGHVVGMTRFGSGFNFEAFHWAHGRLSRIGTFGGLSSEAMDVDNSGRVVGEAMDQSWATHAFVWRRGVLAALPEAPGSNWSSAAAINESGLIAGRMRDGSGYAILLWRPVR